MHESNIRIRFSTIIEISEIDVIKLKMEYREWLAKNLIWINNVDDFWVVDYELQNFGGLICIKLCLYVYTKQVKLKLNSEILRNWNRSLYKVLFYYTK